LYRCVWNRHKLHSGLSVRVQLNKVARIALKLLKGLVDKGRLRKLLHLLFLGGGLLSGLLRLGGQGLGSVLPPPAAEAAAESQAAEGKYAHTTKETNNGSGGEVMASNAEAINGGDCAFGGIALLIPRAQALRSLAFILIEDAAQFYSQS